MTRRWIAGPGVFMPKDDPVMREMIGSPTPSGPGRGRTGLFLGPALVFLLPLALRQAGLAAGPAWATGIVALMATWWITEALALWITALLPILLFPLLAGGAVSDMVLQYFDSVNFLFLGGMWLAASMEQWGLHQRLALGMVSRIGYSPRRIVLGFMLSTGFITLWISNTAAALMMYPIALAVLRRFEIQRGRDDPLLRQFGLALMLGLAYAASIGGIGTKIGTGTNMVFVRQAERTLSLQVSFAQWLAIGLPVVFIALPLVWLFLVRVATRLPASDFPGAREEITRVRGSLGPMSRGEWTALLLFLLAAGMWVTRQGIDLGAFVIPGWGDVMPEGWRSGAWARAFPPPISGLLEVRAGEALVAMILGVALFLIPVRTRPWRSALGWREGSRVQWSLLVILGGGFAMARGVESSGLSGVIAQALQGAPALPPFVITLLVCVIAVAITEFASNVATASILLPLLAASSASLGVNPATTMLAATFAASFGFMLPAGTPPNAVVYASGYVPVQRMARCGIGVDLCGAVLVATLCHWLVPLVLK